MRLIDAEPIKKFIVDGLNNPDLKKAFGHDAIEILTEIEYAPTVDAVPVVHGRWRLRSKTIKLMDDYDEEFYVACNLCKREEYIPFDFDVQKMLDDAKRLYPYCHCGAKMDGGVDDG